MIPSVFQAVKGRHCTVFGSAPGRVPPPRYASTFMICVNGSAIGLDRSPDLTVMGATVSHANNSTSRHTLRNLNGRSSDRVLFVNPGKYQDHEDRFRDFGWDWHEAATMTTEERAEFVHAVTGLRCQLAGHDLPSNGILALLLAAAAGASRIDMCGYSLTGGHYYIDRETPRNHVDQDAAILEWLAAKATVHATDREIGDRFGFPSLPYERPVSRMRRLFSRLPESRFRP